MSFDELLVEVQMDFLVTKRRDRLFDLACSALPIVMEIMKMCSTRNENRGTL
jgi:hypothetical protein